MSQAAVAARLTAGGADALGDVEERRGDAERGNRGWRGTHASERCGVVVETSGDRELARATKIEAPAQGEVHAARLGVGGIGKEAGGFHAGDALRREVVEDGGAR